MGAPLSEGKAENADTMKKQPASAAAAADETTTTTTPLQTYINLIQQYLSVFMVENAVWLAERCVAEYPTSADGVYLLALCHYRANRKKAARQVLESSAAPRAGVGTTTTNSSSSGSSGSSAATASIDYLAAICSYDLKDYNRAEEALLKSCRTLYKQSQRNSMTTASTIESSTTTTSMDEWILSTTVRFKKIHECIALLHVFKISHSLFIILLLAMSDSQWSSWFGTAGQDLSSIQPQSTCGTVLSHVVAARSIFME
jgi:hypothetical protein